MDSPATQKTVVTLDWGMVYSAFLDEAAEMICTHWDEVGSFRPLLTLNPHHERYIAAEGAGMLHILAARNDCGHLVGYFFMIGPSPMLRDKTKRSIFDDVIYVRPEWRRYGVGTAMLREGVIKARLLGADVVFFREKARRNGGGYLRRFGFEPHEIIYAQVLT